jgi:O-antigen ligase
LEPYLRHVEDLRTPHNVFYFALGYTGWIGVALFFGFQAALAVTLWRAWRASGQPFGIVLWMMAIIGGLVGNAFETPFGAIPFYLLTGMAAAELVKRSSVDERVISPQLVPAARW